LELSFLLMVISVSFLILYHFLKRIKVIRRLIIIRIMVIKHMIRLIIMVIRLLKNSLMVIMQHMIIIMG
jgi:hypothetical protein